MEGFLQMRRKLHFFLENEYSPMTWAVVRRGQLVFRKHAPLATVEVKEVKKHEKEIEFRQVNVTPIDLSKVVELMDSDPNSNTFQLVISRTAPYARDVNRARNKKEQQDHNNRVDEWERELKKARESKVAESDSEVDEKAPLTRTQSYESAVFLDTATVRYPGVGGLSGLYVVELQAANSVDKSGWMRSLSAYDRANFDPNTAPRQLTVWELERAMKLNGLLPEHYWKARKADALSAGCSSATWETSRRTKASLRPDQGELMELLRLGKEPMRGIPEHASRAVLTLAHSLAERAAEVGIFRDPGERADVRRFLRSLLAGESRRTVINESPKVVADTLKILLRRLPESLLTAALYPFFVRAAMDIHKAQAIVRRPSSGMQNTQNQTSVSKRIKAVHRLRSLCTLLPEHNRKLLDAIISMCSALHEKRGETQVDLNALSLVLGPSFIPNIGVESKDTEDAADVMPVLFRGLIDVHNNVDAELEAGLTKEEEEKEERQRKEEERKGQVFVPKVMKVSKDVLKKNNLISDAEFAALESDHGGLQGQTPGDDMDPALLAEAKIDAEEDGPEKAIESAPPATETLGDSPSGDTLAGQTPTGPPIGSTPMGNTPAEEVSKKSSSMTLLGLAGLSGLSIASMSMPPAKKSAAVVPKSRRPWKGLGARMDFQGPTLYERSLMRHAPEFNMTPPDYGPFAKAAGHLPFMQSVLFSGLSEEAHPVHAEAFALPGDKDYGIDIEEVYQQGLKQNAHLSPEERLRLAQIKTRAMTQAIRRRRKKKKPLFPKDESKRKQKDPRPYTSRFPEEIMAPSIVSPTLAAPSLLALELGSQFGLISENYRTDNNPFPSMSKAAVACYGPRAKNWSVSVAKAPPPQLAPEPVPDYGGPDYSQAQAELVWHGIVQLRQRIQKASEEWHELRLDVASRRYRAEWEDVQLYQRKHKINYNAEDGDNADPKNKKRKKKKKKKAKLLLSRRRSKLARMEKAKAEKAEAEKAEAEKRENGPGSSDELELKAGASEEEAEEATEEDEDAKAYSDEDKEEEADVNTESDDEDNETHDNGDGESEDASESHQLPPGIVEAGKDSSDAAGGATVMIVSGSETDTDTTSSLQGKLKGGARRRANPSGPSGPEGPDPTEEESNAISPQRMRIRRRDDPLNDHEDADGFDDNDDDEHLQLDSDEEERQSRHRRTKSYSEAIEKRQASSAHKQHQRRESSDLDDSSAEEEEKALMAMSPEERALLRQQELNKELDEHEDELGGEWYTPNDLKLYWKPDAKHMAAGKMKRLIKAGKKVGRHNRDKKKKKKKKKKKQKHRTPKQKALHNKLKEMKSQNIDPSWEDLHKEASDYSITMVETSDDSHVEDLLRLAFKAQTDAEVGVGGGFVNRKKLKDTIAQYQVSGKTAGSRRRAQEAASAAEAMLENKQTDSYHRKKRAREAAAGGVSESDTDTRNSLLSSMKTGDDSSEDTGGEQDVFGIGMQAQNIATEAPKPPKSVTSSKGPASETRHQRSKTLEEVKVEQLVRAKRQRKEELRQEKSRRGKSKPGDSSWWENPPREVEKSRLLEKTKNRRERAKGLLGHLDDVNKEQGSSSSSHNSGGDNNTESSLSTDSDDSLMMDLELDDVRKDMSVLEKYALARQKELVKLREEKQRLLTEARQALEERQAREAEEAKAAEAKMEDERRWKATATRWDADTFWREIGKHPHRRHYEKGSARLAADFAELEDLKLQLLNKYLDLKALMKGDKGSRSWRRSAPYPLYNDVKEDDIYGERQTAEQSAVTSGVGEADAAETGDGQGADTTGDQALAEQLQHQEVLEAGPDKDEDAATTGDAGAPPVGTEQEVEGPELSSLGSAPVARQPGPHQRKPSVSKSTYSYPKISNGLGSFGGLPDLDKPDM